MAKVVADAVGGPHVRRRVARGGGPSRASIRANYGGAEGAGAEKKGRDESCTSSMNRFIHHIQSNKCFSKHSGKECCLLAVFVAVVCVRQAAAAATDGIEKGRRRCESVWATF